MFLSMRRWTLLIVTLLGACSNDKIIDNTPPIDEEISNELGYNSKECTSPAYEADLTSCIIPDNAYQPRDGVAGNNQWPACITDDNKWHMVGDTVPAASARTIAMISIGNKLWANPKQPTPSQFSAARDEYAIEGGLASRVGRRQDVSYPELPGNDKFGCSQANIAQANPDRCAGPSKLQPVIEDAFFNGENGVKPLVQAARIEAALYWFLYLSMTSEVWTCANTNIVDCDSVIGYYAPTFSRSNPTVLDLVINRFNPEAHNRIFDAVLAVGCWRDGDKNLPATNTQLYQRALAQVDQATLHGLSLILGDRIRRIGCTTNEDQEANITFVQLLGDWMHHSANRINPTKAAELRQFTANPTADAAAITKAQADLLAIYPCPST